jgi:hypothetical protein
MARDAARLLAFTLLLALAACGGCAERGDGGAGDGPPATVAAPVEVEAPPDPAPVPVPAALACQVDADCGVSPFFVPVAGPGDCHCPTCPRPLAVAAAGEHESAWRAHCGEAFERRAACVAPMCPRPAAVACREGACVSAAP